MNHYQQSLKSRSPYVILFTIFILYISFNLIIKGDFSFNISTISGTVLLCGVCYNVYSILRGSVTKITISQNSLEYIDTSWPRKHIKINLHEVVKIQLRNDSLKHRFFLQNGLCEKITWVGSPHKLREYLQKEHSEIVVELIEGS